MSVYLFVNQSGFKHSNLLRREKNNTTDQSPANTSSLHPTNYSILVNDTPLIFLDFILAKFVKQSALWCEGVLVVHWRPRDGLELTFFHPCRVLVCLTCSQYQFLLYRTLWNYITLFSSNLMIALLVYSHLSVCLS